MSDKRKREETAMLQLIDERDEAQQALSQAFFLVTGRSPEWSNLFGYKQALEEIDDACTLLRKSVMTIHPTDAFDEAAEREAAFTAASAWTYDASAAIAYITGYLARARIAHADRQKIRREAMEEAAKVAERIPYLETTHGNSRLPSRVEIANAIRALIGPEGGKG